MGDISYLPTQLFKDQYYCITNRKAHQRKVSCNRRIWLFVYKYSDTAMPNDKGNFSGAVRRNAPWMPAVELLLVTCVILWNGRYSWLNSEFKNSILLIVVGKKNTKQHQKLWAKMYNAVRFWVQ